MSSSKRKTACAACKNMQRKCGDNCVFAHHFPPHQPHEFESLRRAYGASNVEKILRDLPVKKRDSALKSLVYEAEIVLKDPVNGCLGYVSILQKRLNQVQTELNTAKQELASYTKRYPNQQPVNRPFDGATKEQDLLSKMDQHQQQSMSFGRCSAGAGSSGQTTQPTHLTAPGAMSPSLALGGLYDSDMGQNQLQQELYNHMLQLVTHQPMSPQHDQPSQSQTQPQPNQGDGSKEGKSVDPSD